MVLPPVRPSTRPRPTNSMVSVAMKAGTLSQVTSTPLISPTSVPDQHARRRRPSRPPGRNGSARRAIENTAATRPRVEPTDRSRSRLTMTKVMPTAITPIARGVAQHGGEGVRGAEEARVDADADQVEHDHDEQQPDLPAAEQLQGQRSLTRGEAVVASAMPFGNAGDAADPIRAKARYRILQPNIGEPSSATLGEVQDPSRPDSRLDGRARRPAFSAARSVGAISSRSACRPCRRRPWSRAGRACPDWRPRCRGRSAGRAASPARSPAGRAAGPSEPSSAPVLDLLLLLGAEVEAVGADLVAYVELATASPIAGVTKPLAPMMPTTSLRLSIRLTTEPTMLAVDVDADVLRAGVDLEVAELAGGASDSPWPRRRR